MEDAVLDGLALGLLLRRLGEHSVDHEAHLTASGIPSRSTLRAMPPTILQGVLALAGEVLNVFSQRPLELTLPLHHTPPSTT